MNIDSYMTVVSHQMTRDASREALEERVTQVFNDDLVEIQVALDERTCQACSAAVGVIYSLNGSTPGYPLISEYTDNGGFHWNCRCMAVITEHVINEMVVRSYDLKDITEENYNYAFPDIGKDGGVVWDYEQMIKEPEKNSIQAEKFFDELARIPEAIETKKQGLALLAYEKKMNSQLPIVVDMIDDFMKTNPDKEAISYFIKEKLNGEEMELLIIAKAKAAAKKASTNKGKSIADLMKGLE